MYYHTFIHGRCDRHEGQGLLSPVYDGFENEGLVGVCRE